MSDGSWIKHWEYVDLLPGSRVVVGYNNGPCLKARVKDTWRNDVKVPMVNYCRFIAEVVYEGNDDEEYDGQFHYVWADLLYPIYYQVIVGTGEDEHALMVFDDRKRAKAYVENYNARVKSQVTEEIDLLKKSGIGHEGDLYIESYFGVLYDIGIRARSAVLRDTVVVPEWATMPSVEL